MGLFSGITDAISNIFGGGGSSNNNKRIDDLFNQNIDGAKSTAEALKELGNKQSSYSNDLNNKLLELLQGSKADVTGALDQNNKVFDEQENKIKNNLAAQGYTNISNNVLNKAVAENAGQRSQAAYNIRNNANQQYLNNSLAGFGLSNNIMSGSYNNSLNSLLQSQNLMQNAYNAQTGYLSNQDQVNQANRNNASSSLLDLLGTGISSYFGGPAGGIAYNALFKGGK